MTTASALFEVFKTLPTSSKEEFVALLEKEKLQKTAFIESLEKGLREVKAIEKGEKEGKTLKQILNGE